MIKKIVQYILHYNHIHIYICVVNIIEILSELNLLTSEVEDTCYVVFSNYKPNHIICISIPWKSTTIRKDGSFFWIMINPSFKNGSSQTKL